MLAELTGYSIKTVHIWTADGHLRWFRNGMKYYAPKELVIEHLMSQLSERTSKEGDGNE